MTQLITLLELRNKIKERKPEFIRQDNPKRMKLNDKWRKPKGIHSKIRHKFKGRRKMPSPGYKSPALAKGLHSSGLEIVRISSINEVNKIKKEKQGIVVSKTVGMKNKLLIFKKAKELDVKVLNLNVDEQIKKIEDFVNSKKKKEVKPKETKKESKEKEKEAKTKEQETTPEKNQTKEVQETETKKEIEKKEKDKVLTKRT